MVAGTVLALQGTDMETRNPGAQSSVETKLETLLLSRGSAGSVLHTEVII